MRSATNSLLRSQPLLACSPHSVDSTPISGAGFPIGFQFLARDPVPRQGFSDFCTEAHFSARFRMGSRGHAQETDLDARGPDSDPQFRTDSLDSVSSYSVIVICIRLVDFTDV